MKRLLIVLLSLMFATDLLFAEGYRELPASTPEIAYTGRIKKGNNGSVSFNWSGTYLEFKFYGEYCAVKVSDTKKNFYNLFIDGEERGVITTFGKDSIIVLAQSLPIGEHSVKLQKRTEGEQGTTTLHSFIIDKQGYMMPNNKKRFRHIEFIGNSITCGYGTEGIVKNEPFRPETENCNLAYGAIISRFFDADYTFISHSGRGAARNYGDTVTLSAVTMRDLMMGTFDENIKDTWNFRDYTPQLVVINLGSNDFSTRPHPSKDEFVGEYKKIIKNIRSKYGDIKILCVAPPKGDAFDYIREMVSSYKDSNIAFAAYLNGVYNLTNDLGASGHPNYRGQIKIAMTLIPHISSLMGWDMEDKVIK